jgi:hypothetical protein
MRNDPPSNLRRAHGYLEARSSGVTGYERPPEAWKMNWHVECAAAEKRIRALSKADPAIIPLLLDLKAQLKRENRDSAPWVLTMLYWERPELAPAGYWDGRPDWQLPEQLRKNC